MYRHLTPVNHYCRTTNKCLQSNMGRCAASNQVKIKQLGLYCISYMYIVAPRRKGTDRKSKFFRSMNSYFTNNFVNKFVKYKL